MNKMCQNFFDFLFAVPVLPITSDGLYYFDCRALENFCKACCVLHVMIYECSSCANLTIEGSIDRQEAADQAVLLDELSVRTCCSNDGLSVRSHHPAVTPPPPSPDIDVIRPWYYKTRTVEMLYHVWKAQIGLQRNMMPLQSDDWTDLCKVPHVETTADFISSQ